MKKNIIYVIMLLVGLTLNLNAQLENDAKVENAIENCYESLTHSNQGVAESAIFVSIQFKNKFPNKNAGKFVDALDEIASESENPRISYKAQLAKMYFNNTEWFKDIVVDSIENEQKVYEKIAETLSNKMFAADF